LTLWSHKQGITMYQMEITCLYFTPTLTPKTWIIAVISTETSEFEPRLGEVYSIQHYVIKFVSDFPAADRWFSSGTLVSSTSKTDLKVCGRLACYTCNRSRFSSPIKFGSLKKSFNNISAISWRSVLLVEETRVPEENHRSAAE
jgi:hypothetical protein